MAICGGSGQGFYKDALKKGAQVFITGDVYYHTGQEMITNGLLAIDPGHHIEALFISKIAEKLESWKREHDWNVTILESQSSTNTFDDLSAFTRTLSDCDFVATYFVTFFFFVEVFFT